MQKQMKQFSHPNWILFASRLSTIFQRSFRKECYFSPKGIFDFSFSSLLVIKDEGVDLMFVKKAEDEKNFRLVLSDYSKGKVEKFFPFFKKIARDYVVDSIDDTVRSAIQAHRFYGNLIMYSHYLDRIIQKPASKGRGKDQRLPLVIKTGEFLRNLVSKMDESYFKARNYLIKNGISKKKIDYVLVDELLREKEFNWKQVDKRKGLVVMEFTPRKCSVYTDRKAKIFLSDLGFTCQITKLSDNGAIKGLVAFSVKDKIVGRVLLAKSTADLKKRSSHSKEAMIVVVPMTMADFIPYLRKVKAIITDEGGLTCHAAIISRELKIPCIIGTKIATKILKDGDFVEVDAEKGIVRKLSK